MMAGFVKRTLKNAHGALVERLCQKVAIASSQNGASPNGSISVHTNNEKLDNWVSGGQVDARHLSSRPTSSENVPRPQGYVPYRKPAPLPTNGPMNNWAGTHQQAPAELQ